MAECASGRMTSGLTHQLSRFTLRTHRGDPSTWLLRTLKGGYSDRLRMRCRKMEWTRIVTPPASQSLHF